MKMNEFLQFRLIQNFFLLTAIVVPVFLPTNAIQNYHSNIVLGTFAASDQVLVRAKVSPCRLDLTVKPEKRIPAVNNWGTLLTVDMYNVSMQKIYGYQTQSDKYGNGSCDFCKKGVTLDPGTYNFYVRGFSHLRKNMGAHYTLDRDTNYLNLSGTDKLLLAGETSNIFDNKINSLDLSTQIVHLFSGDNKNDLNQDSKVNSLDISNTITNFFLTGD